MTETRIIKHAHICCGIGGGASGFNRAQARVKSMQAKFVCLGGIDVDLACCIDFEQATGVKATRCDLMTTGQYLAFHGERPPRGWREAQIADIHRAFQNQRPHIGFMSMPCKGFSGLLSQKLSESIKYQALNGLTLRGLWLFLEAYQDDPVELILFENVPRIATRGRWLLDQIVALFRAYGYAVAETKHDCGEIGGLAQHRERFLLVARHMEKVPAFLYEPPKRPLRGVGEILEKLPLPGLVDAKGALLGGPMHRVPRLQWKTWVRLAFVEAGSDWRSLNRLRVENGALADYGIAQEADYHKGVYGVKDWSEPSATVTGRATPSNGAYAVADPRVDGHPKSVQLGVRPWDKPAGVVTGKMIAGGGPHAVADPRIAGKPRFNHVYRIVRFDQPAPAVTSADGGKFAVADPRYGWADAHESKMRVQDWERPSRTIAGSDRVGSGALSVADPRTGYGGDTRKNVLRVTPWDKPGGTVTSGHGPSNGVLSVADPRWREGRESYLTSGHYGVVPWNAPSGAIRAAGQHDNSAASVADPREFALPDAADNLVCLIRALDGTWHRPFTTLECAALQSLVDLDRPFDLYGASDSAKRERIGNCVPRDAAAAIASVMGQLLLLVWSGETAPLADTPVWVRPLAVALAVKPIEAPQ